ncbi:unnamed protein product, partial [marine sediment metagenome]
GKRRSTHALYAIPIPAGELTDIPIPPPGMAFVNNICVGIEGGTVDAYEAGCSGYEVGAGVVDLSTR